ncbi:MAG: DNA topoisomerase I, partial [Salinivirgaceae bacterium]|nr:DNA topoisomerase I [Salinivirgaceae bacterium]
IGDGENDEKPQFASLHRDQHIETITLEEVLDLFKLPRQIGEYEGKTVTVAIGRFGPYVRHNNSFYSLKRNVDDPYTVTLERAIELINEKREAEKNKVINVFEGKDGQIQVLNGFYGPYIAFDGKNYRIAKGTDAKALTVADCEEIIKNSVDKPAKKRVSKKAN